MLKAESLRKAIIVDRPQHNTHKVLKELVAVNAWFTNETDDTARHSLKASITFSQERLGQEPESRVLFKVSLSSCDVVVIPPGVGREFSVDPASIKLSKPTKNFRSKFTRTKSTRRSIATKLGLKGMKPDADLAASYESLLSSEHSIVGEQEIDPFNVLSKKTSEQYPAWRIESKHLQEKRLWGALWDTEIDTLLDVIDNRSQAQIDKSIEDSLPPTAYLEVRCRSEDLVVEYVEFKEEVAQKTFNTKPHRENKLRAAEAFLAFALRKEGLKVSDLSNPYSEVTVCEAAIPIDDRSTRDG